MLQEQQKPEARIRDLLLISLQIGVGILLLVPFLYTGGTTFPFIVGKVITFRVIIEIMVVAALLLVVLDPTRRPRKTWMLILLGGWVASLVLSTFFGVDAYRSFWGNHERMTGVFTLIHYAIFALIAAMVFETERSWRRLWGWALATSIVMAAIGFVQYLSPTGLLHTAGGGRIWATLGNYIYLAQYSLFFLFLGLWFAFTTARRFRPLAWIVVATQATILLLSETRGALLGAFVGVMILCVWIMRTPNNKTLRKLGSVSLASIIVLSAVIWFAKDTKPIRMIPGIRRVSEINFVSGGSQTRLIAWSIALEAFKARPIFGWGIENYYYAFNRYYHPESLKYSFYETWFDRAHNAFLDLLSMQGAVGGVVTLGLYGMMFVVFARHRKRNAQAYLEAGFAAAMLASYLAQNVFVFDSPTSFLLFFLLAGWALRMEWGYGKPESLRNSVCRPAPLGSAITGAFALSMLVLVFTTNILPLRANMIGLQGSAILRSTGNALAGAEKYLEALAVPNQMVRDLRTDMAREVSEILGRQTTAPDAAARAWQIVTTEIGKNVAARPYDTYDRIVMGQLLAQGASYDPSALEKAAAVLEEAIPLSPKRQQTYYSLSRIRLLQGNATEAVRMLEETVKLEPTIPDSHWYLGLALHDAGDLPRAWEEIQRGRELGYQWKSPVEMLFIAEVARKLGFANEQVALLEEAKGSYGNIGEFHARLAEAYGAAGDVEKAQEESVRAVYLDEKLKDRMKELLAKIGG